MGVPIMNKELSSREFDERAEDLGNEPEKHKSHESTAADSQDDY
jgi:hypothetical protein